jgi:hypothetical protein
MFTKRSITITVAGVALAAFLFLTQTASSTGDAKSVKLEGAWIGNTPGLGLTTWVWTPDPSGRRASCIVHPISLDPAFLASLGADSVSAFPVEAVMTGPNRGTVTEVAYPLNAGQIVGIVLISGTFEFTSPYRMEIVQQLALYPAAADADGDGLPDPGTAPVMTIPATTFGTRLP